MWKKTAGEIGGRSHTLSEIEHEILRPMGEPRIHAAIVCASLSCPPLRREPYRAGELHSQLEDNVRRWLADPRKGLRIDRSARTLHLSPILDWFAEDFGESVIPFVEAHLPQTDAEWIRAQGSKLRVRYLEYDWRVNDVARSTHALRSERVARRIVSSGEPRRSTADLNERSVVIEKSVSVPERDSVWERVWPTNLPKG